MFKSLILIIFCFITHAQANEFNFNNYLDDKLKKISIPDKMEVKTSPMVERNGVTYYLVVVGQKERTSFFVGVKENQVVFETQPLPGGLNCHALGDNYWLYYASSGENLYHIAVIDFSTLENIVISKKEPLLEGNMIYNKNDNILYFLSEKDGDKANLYYFDFKDKKIKKGNYDKPYPISIILNDPNNDCSYLRYNDGFNNKIITYKGYFEKIIEEKAEGYINTNQHNFKIKIGSNIEVPVRHSVSKTPSNLLFVVFSQIDLLFLPTYNPFTDQISFIGDKLGYETLTVFQPGYRDLGRKYRTLPFGDVNRYQNYLSNILEKIHQKFPTKKIIAVGDDYTANALLHVALKHPSLMDGLVLHNGIYEWKSYLSYLNDKMFVYKNKLVKLLGDNPELSDGFNTRISILKHIKNLPSKLPIFIYYDSHPQLPWSQQSLLLNEEMSKEKKKAFIKENKEHVNSLSPQEADQKSVQLLYNLIQEYLQAFNFTQDLSKENKQQQINEPLNLPSNQSSSKETHTINEISGMSPISGMNSIIGSDLQEIRKDINNKKFTPEAQKKALKEFERLKMMQPFAPEAAEIRKYLDWLLSFPWVAEKNQK
ncbi:MAG: hypothetical protein J0H12_07445, partial [Candidatus Paracaedimonas acanthamoebae]|nr:hypothetical protein [Candidatus Paracaedimonas acanthamoebae]